jgi:hypothetical protein
MTDEKAITIRDNPDCVVVAWWGKDEVDPRLPRFCIRQYNAGKGEKTFRLSEEEVQRLGKAIADWPKKEEGNETRSGSSAR